MSFCPNAEQKIEAIATSIVGFVFYCIRFGLWGAAVLHVSPFL